jgi:hypothetical protein
MSSSGLAILMPKRPELALNGPKTGSGYDSDGAAVIIGAERADLN